MHRYNIKIKGIRIISALGWYAGEQATGNQFEVNIKMRVRRAAETPVAHISETADYAQIYPIVKDCFDTAAVQLIEHVVEQIGKKIIDRIEMVDKVRVEVKKLNPFLGPDTASVAIEAVFFK